MTIQEFLQQNITSTTGLLIRCLVQRLANQHNDIPDQYVGFIANTAKLTSVCGLLQVTQDSGPEALEILWVSGNLNICKIVKLLVMN